ncbi:hypothetical protein JH06_0432 [Blastocystis sp. subtype 4]|uniref:hypothetical protein n=1 Tax=Blastocystis sp. subtype 4 TaxID=944170 RepID=UPI000711FA18|nr:hypothetical protein JH06_0432 [Blastocystis sp. subtype 4]KNB46006.1 hypothetical protein JH06_0432 [Blastocystis sp. subtype 4]|eukprot:XP_014529449.1 hypothetical protein JH06_0432 [Blastocystis sp. subtype 4]
MGSKEVGPCQHSQTHCIPIHCLSILGTSTLQTKLMDNSCTLYEATYGKEGYGAKASDILIKVRGKDFRREKTKKKRGNYSGGRISMEVKSTRFDDDE